MMDGVTDNDCSVDSMKHVLADKVYNNTVRLMTTRKQIKKRKERNTINRKENVKERGVTVNEAISELKADNEDTVSAVG